MTSAALEVRQRAEVLRDVVEDELRCALLDRGFSASEVACVVKAIAGMPLAQPEPRQRERRRRVGQPPSTAEVRRELEDIAERVATGEFSGDIVDRLMHWALRTGSAAMRRDLVAACMLITGTTE